MHKMKVLPVFVFVGLALPQLSLAQNANAVDNANAPDHAPECAPLDVGGIDPGACPQEAYEAGKEAAYNETPQCFQAGLCAAAGMYPLLGAQDPTGVICDEMGPAEEQAWRAGHDHCVYRPGIIGQQVCDIDFVLTRSLCIEEDTDPDANQG